MSGFEATADIHNTIIESTVHPTKTLFACHVELKLGGHWGCGSYFTRAAEFKEHLDSDEGQECIKRLKFEVEYDRFQPKGREIPASLLAQYPDLAEDPKFMES